MSGEPTCVNLQERFGRRYRVRWEADGRTKTKWRKEEWPWLMEIRCRYGVVFPRGGDVLGAITTRPRIGRRLRALQCVLTARGDAETAVTFYARDAAAVFRLLRPFRRRQVTPMERERLCALLAVRAPLDSTRGGRTKGGFPVVESTNDSGGRGKPWGHLLSAVYGP